MQSSSPTVIKENDFGYTRPIENEGISQSRQHQKSKGNRNLNIREALAQEPENPRPPKDEMLRIFRSGGYLNLVPYFKKEIGSVKSTEGVRLRIMKHVDPESFALKQEKRIGARQREKEGAKRKKRKYQSSIGLHEEDTNNLEREVPHESMSLLSYPSQSKTCKATRIEQALLQEPRYPAPTKAQMREMYRSGQYFDLIPYFKKEIGNSRSFSHVRRKILRVIDPHAFTLETEKQRISEMKSKMKKSRRV
jgi:hypothetical protein